MAYKDITATIGNTPLVKLDFGTPPTIYAKLEYFNPSGSIKDRSSLYMIQAAEQRKDIYPGGTIIEASSGNQGIATSMIASMKGYNAKITVSDQVSPEKQKTLAAYGAQLITCPQTSSLYDPESYLMRAHQINEATPNSYMLNQYTNPDNTMAHYVGIGPEIWHQTDGHITHLCTGVGSGGTISGAGRYLKEQNPNISVLGVDSPCSYRATNGNPQPYQLEGLGANFEAPLVDTDIIDDFLWAPDNDAIAMFHWLAQTYGIFVGPAGAAVAAMVYQYSQHLHADDTVVFICGDSGRAYLSRAYCTPEATQTVYNTSTHKPHETGPTP